MPLDLRGQQLRYSFIPKKEQYKRFVEFATDDVGRKGYLQRFAGKDRNKNWYTIGWIINLRSYDDFDEVVETIKEYFPIKYQKKAISLARRWWRRNK
jgi:hypothetical protein